MNRLKALNLMDIACMAEGEWLRFPRTRIPYPHASDGVFAQERGRWRKACAGCIQ